MLICVVGAALLLAPLPAFADDTDTNSSKPPAQVDLDNGANFERGNGKLVKVVTPSGTVVDIPVEVALDDTIEVTNDGLLVTEPGTYGPHPPHDVLDAQNEPAETASTSGITADSLQKSPSAAQAYQLHSNPLADLIIYLDFTGHTTTGTPWNQSPRPSTFTSAPYQPSDPANTESYIVKIWEMVAEDFAPFNVDVTTEEPSLDDLKRDSATDGRYGIRIVISPTDDWYGGCGRRRLHQLDALDRRTDRTSAPLPSSSVTTSPAATGSTSPKERRTKLATRSVFTTTESDRSTTTRATRTPPEPAGHPIMGTGYNVSQTQWSKGEYPGATQTQDDLSILFDRLGARDAGARGGPRPQRLRHRVDRSGRDQHRVQRDRRCRPALHHHRSHHDQRQSLRQR